VLVNTKGQPWRTGFGSSWETRREARRAMRRLHFHDLRGTAATRFYRGGLSIREIAEIMTWSEDYVRSPDRPLREEGRAAAGPDSAHG
jgi:integrase